MLTLRAEGAAYFISNSGNDSNNGLSAESPWLSIDKLNSSMKRFLPGDVILFQRSGYFSGQITLTSGGTPGNPVIIGSYGDGPMPVISGAVIVKNWSPYKENIYKSEVNIHIRNLFVNGKQMTIAKFPNKGFLQILKPFQNAHDGFAGSNLDQLPGYWNGSMVRVRTENWAYEHTVIKNFENGKITFLNPTIYPVKKGWGFYIDNNLNELDEPNEWYFESKSSKGILYYYPENKSDINSIIAEASVFDYGIYLPQGVSHIFIRDIEFRNQHKAAIFSSNFASNISIDNCTFSGQNEFGISVSTGKHFIISNNRFIDINGFGIYMSNSGINSVNDNIFKRIGMIPGYGAANDPFGMSAVVMLNSDSNQVFQNYIDSVGHDGINCIGNNNIVEKNLICNALMMLNDGGGIKSYGKNSLNSIFRDNFISNVRGNIEATFKKDNRLIAAGIYLDDYCNSMRVLNNTVTQNQSGIMLSGGCTGNVIMNNIAYGNEEGFCFYLNQNAMKNNLFADNFVFSITPGQVTAKMYSFSNQFEPGKFEKNYYYSFRNIVTFEYNSTELSFLQWKKLIGNNPESGSTTIENEKTRMPQIISNMGGDTITHAPIGRLEYFDLKMKKQKSNLTIYPWSAGVIYGGAENNLPQLNVFGNSLNFSGLKNEVKWYVLICEDIKQSVSITASQDFEISFESDRDYADVLSFIPSAESQNQIVFVRSKNGTMSEGSVVNSSGRLNYTVSLSSK